MLYPLSYEGGGSNENGRVDRSNHNHSRSVACLGWPLEAIGAWAATTERPDRRWRALQRRAKPPVDGVASFVARLRAGRLG
jgi:hypothetical protein